MDVVLYDHDWQEVLWLLREVKRDVEADENSGEYITKFD